MSEYPHAIPVDRINTSLREQTGEWRVASGEAFLEQGFEGTRSNEDAMEKSGGAMQELLSRTGTPREDVKDFRIS